jgi:hypothetical protein
MPCSRPYWEYYNDRVLAHFCVRTCLIALTYRRGFRHTEHVLTKYWSNFERRFLR